MQHGGWRSCYGLQPGPFLGFALGEPLGFVLILYAPFLALLQKIQLSRKAPRTLLSSGLTL